MPAIGYTAQVLALILSLYAIVVSVVGARKNRQDLVMSARNASLGATIFLAIAVLAMEYLLIVGHYQTEYVADVTNNDTVLFYRMTGLWASQDGSLLFFAFIMSIFTGGVLLWKWGAVQNLIPYTMAVLNAVLIFFIGLVVTVANPFSQLPFFPPDGQGMNPMLYHWGMIIHPPILYVGFAGFIVPYAFSMAALITRQRGDLWMRTSRRWTLVAWIFLGMGLLLGGRWAYDVLGWGGYWGWDAVENAALIPWLVATPFIHSVMMQESRGMMKRWNVALMILTFSLVIEGTFLTRSGVIGSVHTFAQSAIGPLFLGFIGLMFIPSLALFVLRWDDLSSDNELDSLLSRESAFLLANLLFIALAFTVWWGTHFPIISEAVTGEKIVVGPPFFEKTVGPLFAALVLLMGIAPLMPWRRITSRKLLYTLRWPALVGALVALGLYFFTWVKLPGALMTFAFLAFTMTTTLMEYGRGINARHRARGENFAVAMLRLTARNRRRYGGYLVHIGVVLLSIGIVGMEFYQVETQQNIDRGETMIISSSIVGTYELTYQGMEMAPSQPGIEITQATLTVSQNGQVIGELKPYQEFFVRQQQPMTIADIHRDFMSELYVIVAGWEADGSSATFKAYINPFINWLWLGGLVLVFGTLVAAWPSPEPIRRNRKVKSKPKKELTIGNI
ncbi:MAG TPA: heme lyase CcmF/NrfE family subunit [Chloroflexi bacterium]|nr:heme lyase CcmF/NrfE family subunit [Chloroflexota bacterium]